MKCIAIDDEPRALDIISNYAERIPFISLEAVYTNAIEALIHLKDTSIDLIILDINMPDILGTQLLGMLNHNPLVIFSTAYPEYAVESYELKAVDYLLKPYEFSRFLKAVSKAKEVYDSAYTSHSIERDFMFIKSGNQQQKIFFNDILYLEGAGNYVTFHTGKNKVLLRMPLKEVACILPNQLFVQVHKSFIVSLRNIDKISENQIYIQNKRISIGNTYREQLYKML